MALVLKAPYSIYITLLQREMRVKIGKTSTRATLNIFFELIQLDRLRSRSNDSQISYDKLYSQFSLLWSTERSNNFYSHLLNNCSLEYYPSSSLKFVERYRWIMKSLTCVYNFYVCMYMYSTMYIKRASFGV